ncbi:MAG: hypothetical protein ACK5LX_12270 [Oscillospiraceae bacterium]
MTRTRIFVRQMLSDLTVFALLHSLLLTGLFAIYRELTPVWISFVLLLPFLAMTVVREKVDNLFLFLLLHILLAATAVLLPLELIAKGLCFLLLVIAAIYSLVVQLRGYWSVELGWTGFCVGVLAVLALVTGYLRFGRIPLLLTLWATLVVACYFVCYQTLRVDEALSFLPATGRKVVPSILRFNNIILLGFLVPVLLAAALAVRFPLNGLFTTIAAAFKQIVRWIFGLLARFGGEAQEELPPETPEPSPSYGLPETEPGDSSWFLEILEQIILRTVQVALVVGVVALIVYALRKLYKRFYASKAKDGDVREYIGPELQIEALKASWRSLLGRLPRFGRSESERIRKIYYKRVNRHIWQGARVAKSDTTGDIRRKLAEADDLTELTDSYNDARYGPPAKP